MSLTSDLDRRDFLKKFSILSTAPLVFSSCIWAAYGPPEYENLQVLGIYYKDIRDWVQPLDKAVNVETETELMISFSKEMDEDSSKNIHLINIDREEISFISTWDTPRSLSISLEVPLQYGSLYTLEVDENTVSSEMEKVVVNDNLIAEFSTTHIEFDVQKINIKPNEEKNITINNVYNSDGTLSEKTDWQIVAWRSGDSSIVIVDTNGKAQGVNTGTTVIQVDVLLKNVVYCGYCNVTVEE